MKIWENKKHVHKISFTTSCVRECQKRKHYKCNVKWQQKPVNVLRHYFGFRQQEGEKEAPAIIKDKRPPVDWPRPGEIKFDRYKMRYRDNLPLALKGLKFTIRAKEKIGIVGRSGSGETM